MPDGHNAQACNNMAMVVVKHYSIRRNDIVLSTNDMTNVSIATDQLIANSDGICNIHFKNLACNHVTRK
jgi:hypothetical protein